MKTGYKSVYVRVPEEIAQLWKFQAFLERRTLKEVIMDAMEAYISNYFREAGYDLAVEEEFEVEAGRIEDINWELLEEAGIDTEQLRESLKEQATRKEEQVV